jgi:cytochrome c oxidase subunit 2
MVTHPASGETHQITDLFWVMLVLSGIIFIAVTGVLLYSAVRFRAKPGVPEPTQVFGNRRVELIWTIVPTIILMIAFVFTVRAMESINSPHGNAAVFNINVIGHQWWWEFQYPVQKIDTANEIHIPTGVYIHYHVESGDVIHAFWLPQLQRQIDANPGQDNAVFTKIETPGVYDGTCYEYCGAAHAWMKFRAIVQSPAQFAAWAKHMQTLSSKPVTALQQRGQYVFLHNTCVSCHTIDGTTAGGAVGPNLTHLASRWGAAGASLPITQNDLMAWIHDPNTYKPGVVMPGYPFLSKSDLRALAAYLISLK